MGNWEPNGEETDVDWGKPCINQHEMSHIICDLGLPSEILEGFTVIQTEEVNMEWQVDGITLREAIMFDDRTMGFRILYRNLMGPDRKDHLEETLAFMRHHWNAWRSAAGMLGDL